MNLRLSSTLAAIALFVAGCGSSSSSSSSTAASSGASAPATNPAYSTGGASTATPVSISTTHAKLGTFLVAGPKQLSVYLFDSDKGTRSSCYGKCAVVWPPVLGSATAVGGARSADLGTTHRKNGSTQVTYKGHPLYYYVKDKAKGDTFGAGIVSFGAKWYVLMPSGNKIDNT